MAQLAQLEQQVTLDIPVIRDILVIQVIRDILAIQVTLDIPVILVLQEQQGGRGQQGQRDQPVQQGQPVLWDLKAQEVLLDITGRFMTHQHRDHTQ